MKKFTQVLEDLYASDYKEKEFMGPDGKWHKRKLRPHRVDFKASKMRGEPAQKDSGEDVGMKEQTTPYWKKPSFNKRMSALAKQERLAREKKEAEKKTVKEENMTIDEQINEVLSKDATAGDWIHDFVHSDNPKFAGKSKDKRKQMALAAYYAKQRNEEVELEEDTQTKAVLHKGKKIGETGIDSEASPGNGKWFAKHHKSGMDSSGFDSRKEAEAEVKAAHGLHENAPVAPVPDRKYIKGTPEWKAHKEKSKPINGHPTNVKEGSMKTFKELIQSLDERSDQAKQNKAMKNMMDASRGARYKLNNPVPDADPEHKTAQAHNKAIGRALRNEEKEEKPPFDGPYTKSPGNVKDKSGAVHTPMSRARDLARKAMKQQYKEEFDLDITDEQADELMLEALVGGQKKLDKNHNGKIDSSDLKMIRGEACPECGKSPCECGHMKEEKQKYSGLEAMKKMGLPTAARSHHATGVNIDTVEGWDHPHDAVKKKEMQKEENEVETRSLSFSDFISQLNEYTPGPGGVTRVQGRSYGAQYRDPEGEDDADDKKKQVAKSEPAVKRGRGRPAGSKSGANQKVTSGKKGSGVDYTGYKLHLPNTNR